MLVSHRNLNSLAELRGFVHSTLCERESLLAEQYRMREEVLMSRDTPCAVQFTIRGPRSIKLGAIWAMDQGVIYFYDTKGERYLRVTLDKSVTVTAAELTG